MSEPCDTCKRVHRGPRCRPGDQRRVPMQIGFPAHVHRELMDRVPWGERSGWVADVVAAALDEMEGAE